MKEVVHIGTRSAPVLDLQELVARVARGEQEAFAGVYDAVATASASNRGPGSIVI
ncbi:hypothetical protein [Streptomyces lasiicapitis]|uniref:hypothetical protein n=1 Tax=Streptomyces lasiicapitis TaxID=1923961 RepID=UPI003D9F3EDA